MRHQRGLGVFGQRKFFVRSLEHQLGQLLLQGFVDFLEHFPGGCESRRKVATHADGLAALAWEDKRMNRHDAVTLEILGLRTNRIGAGA